MSIISILKAVAIAVTSFALTMKAFLGTITKVNQTESALYVGDYGYATFYDDNACTENPGTAVSMANDGCLANEIGRNSIYIQPGCLFVGYLVWSPGTDCDCQDECAPVPDKVIRW